MVIIIPAFKTPFSRKFLLAASGILFFVSPVLPEIFCIRQFAGMLIFFVGGTVVSDYMTAYKITSFSSLWQVVSVIGFVAFAWAYLSIAGDYLGSIGTAILTLTVNIFGIAMSMTLAYRWRMSVSTRLLKVTYSVAGASYIIYLLHTTFEGFAKGFLSKVHWFELSPHLLTSWGGAIIAIVCGVLIPWWLGTKILGRWKTTAFLFGITQTKNKS